MNNIAAEVDVLLDREARDFYFSIFNLLSETSVANELKLVKFNSVGFDMVDSVDSLHNHFCVFSGESDYEMKPNINASLFSHFHGINNALPRVAAVDELQSGVVGTFCSIFNNHAVMSVNLS